MLRELIGLDNVYRQMLEKFQVHLGDDYNDYFQVKPEGDVENGRVVQFQELSTYFDILENFNNVNASIQDKSELCKCALLHSDIMDRAFLNGNGVYNRCVI